MAQLIVDGVVQSVLPPPEWGYWKYMVPDTEPKSVLMLGAGWGTIARMIKDKYPNTKIKGIEKSKKIWKKAIKLGVWYQLGTGDAFSYVDWCDERFDLILVDLWAGGWYPTQVFKPEFVNKLRNLLNPSGKIYINAPNIHKFAQLNNLKIKGESEGGSIVYET